MATGAPTLTNTAPVNTRNVKDVNFVVTAALPNAANTVNTSGVDFWAGANNVPVGSTPYATTQYVQAFVGITTLGNGANNKNINVVLQDSNDNSNWTNLFAPGNVIYQPVDANGAGYAVSNVKLLLPPGTRRYVRASATGEANGGNAANGTLTFQLLF